RLVSLVAVAAVSVVVASACSSGSKGTTTPKTQAGSLADCATKPNDCNGGTVKAGGTLTYTIEKTVTGWNINTSETNTFDIAEVLNPLLPGAFLVKPDLSVALNDDVMVSAEQTNTNPQTIV